MDILYYSNHCSHSQKLLDVLVKNGFADKLNYVCIDKRIRDPNTQFTYIVLDNGDQVLLPPNVSRVPSMVVINQMYRVITGDEIYDYLKPKLEASSGGGGPSINEPTGYILGQSSGGVNIVSETFTPYDMPASELLTMGNGPMRQMYNYAPVNENRRIEHPEETYKSNKLTEDVTLDSLQQKRNQELQSSMPPLASHLNQAIMPGVRDVYPPADTLPPQLESISVSKQSRSQLPPQFSTTYAPINAAPKYGAEDARELLFGKNSGWSGPPIEDPKSQGISAPYLAGI